MFCPDFDVSLWIRKYKITVAIDTYSVVKSFMYSNTCIRLIIIVDFETVQPFPFWQCAPQATAG